MYSFNTLPQPVPADAEIDALLNVKTEELTRALLEDGVKSSKVRSCTTKSMIDACANSGRLQLVVALYPTPAAPRQERPAAPPKPRPLAPAVTSALGWFSASAKALATGVEEEEPAQAEDEAELGQVWEAWIVDVDVVAEGRRGVSEESELIFLCTRAGLPSAIASLISPSLPPELRSQLNDFLLRSLMFVMERTTQVPPITTADLQPFGVQVSGSPHFFDPVASIRAEAYPLDPSSDFDQSGFSTLLCSQGHRPPHPRHLPTPPH